MTPVRVDGRTGRVVVPGCEVRFSPLGSVPAKFEKTAAKLELSGSLVMDIRESELTEPTVLGFVEGEVTSGGAGTLFRTTAPFQQNDPTLAETFEKEGHRRPRRKLFLRFVQDAQGPELTVLLPDEMQVLSGHVEVFAKLTVGGSEHGTEEENDVLDVPLLPLRETHAVFQFFDGAGEPLSELTARFESGGDEIEATTDAFGEIFLDASENQTYTFIDAVPADERLAVSAAEFSRPTSSVA